MTTYEFFDLQTRFVLWRCAIVIANFSLLLSAEASIGTPWDAYIFRRDASLPGIWQTTFLRSGPPLWLMLRALRRNQRMRKVNETRKHEETKKKDTKERNKFQNDMKNRWNNNWKENETEKNKTWGFFRRSFFSKKKKSEEFKECERDVLPNFYFSGFLRRDKQEERENTKGTFLIFRRTNKQGTEFLFKKRDSYIRKHFQKKKNIFFVKKGGYEKGEIDHQKNWVFCSKKKGKTIRKKRWDISKRSFFFKKKSWKDKKTGDAKGDKTNSENHRNQKEGQETRKMRTKKKKKNKTKRT